MTTPVGPYTPIVRAGDWLICSGQIGIADGALVGSGLTAQLGQALANMAELLEGQGAAVSDVVKTTVFLVDMDDYAEMNEVYESFMATYGDSRPARSAVAVAALPLGARVEVEAWAHAPGL